MKRLNKNDIFAALDLKTEVVDVPEWGGSIGIRTMTGADRDAFENSLVRIEGDKRIPDLSNMRAKLVAMTAVDEHGDRLFEVADIPALAEKSAAALERVFDVAQRLNGLGQAAAEEIAKN